MARLVKRFRKLPYAVTLGAETASICGCGLSGGWGHHRQPLIDDALSARNFGREIDDEQQLVAEPGGPGRAHEPLFLPCRVGAQKADRLAFSGLGQDPYVDARGDAQPGAKFLDRAVQTRRVAASG